MPNPKTPLPEFQGPTDTIHPRDLRVLFMGTPDFAVPTLEKIYDLGCDVCGVFTQPTRPRGRGRKPEPPPVARLATAKGTPVFQWPRLTKRSYAAMCELDPDVCVVAAYGRILPRRYLVRPRFGCINVHASLLPRWRGAAPIQWAIVAGDRETGISVMRMDVGMDTGDMAQVAKTPIGPDETAGELHDRLATLGAQTLGSALERLCAGELRFTPQSDEGVTMAPMLQKADGRLDWSQSAGAIRNRVRGLSPWPGAYVDRADGPLKIRAVQRIDDGHLAGPRPGVIVAHDPEGPRVSCGDGAVTILQAQRPGKRVVSGADLVRGWDAMAVGLRIDGEPSGSASD